MGITIEARGVRV